MESSIKQDDKYLFGFWLYLMTDLVIFGVLFAVYVVLRDSTFGGPSARELFSLPPALAETLTLLTSSLTSGLAMISGQRGKLNQTTFWLIITFILGALFIVFELTEFSHLVSEGNSWSRNAFLSSFFTLVGTHGLHISVGLLWILVAIAQLRIQGLTSSVTSKLARFTIFWHFLDVVWIFIFTIVYLMSHTV